MHKDNATKYNYYFSLVGVPYAEMHCWELVVSFYKSVLGIELKHYWDEDVPADKTQIQSLITSNMGDFFEVDYPRYGDIVVIKIRGIESHLGVYTGHGMFLHTQEKSGSVVDRISRWEKMIVGYFRLKEGLRDD